MESDAMILSGRLILTSVVHVRHAVLPFVSQLYHSPSITTLQHRGIPLVQVLQNMYPSWGEGHWNRNQATSFQGYGGVSIRFRDL